MSGQGNFEQTEKPTSTEAPKTSGTQHHPAEVNNMSGWATILARLATILARWAPDWLPTGWIGNRLARLANEAPIGNRSTQNIQGDYGRQANNFGTQNQPKYDFAPAPAPKTSGNQQQRHPKHPTTTAEVNNGNQNIQGDYGIQANNAGYQERPTFTFS